MKKITSFFALILLLSALAYAQDDWYYSSQSLVIDINVSSSAVIQPKSSDYSVKYITVNLSHYPYTDFGQKVLSIKAYPEPLTENNAMLFRWENPRDKISFGYDARLKTSSNIVGVKEKIPFPIKNIPDDIKQFTKPSEIIDSNNEDIIGFASEIAQGEDDLYVVVHKIAEWTKSNVKYNLSTLTAEVSQKASWVLENRQGVCDELTSLFIAMLRSLGIPAKFVSGVAYTNDPSFPENWGSHGWAEVYFPGYGWIPYDVTYGEFGYIDPTHVKLKESFDTSEPSVKYAWVAHNVDDLETKKIEISTSLADKIGRVENPISMDINALRENIGFSSYNLIEAVLKNPGDYYISSEVFLSMPKEVEIIGDNFKPVLLKPNEKKSVFWIVKLTGSLEDNFIYTFPISISVVSGAEKNASFKSAKNEINYNFNEMQGILQQKEEEEQKAYSMDVDINCSIGKKEFYYYENALVKCRIRNMGNTFLKGLNACFQGKCSKLDLGIAQEKGFNYSIENPAAGKQESAFKVENSDVSKAQYIEYNVLDKPEIKIMDVEFPSEVSYEDEFKVNFLLKKESLSFPKNARIALASNNIKQEWAIKELNEDRKFVVNMLGKNLRKGVNEFDIVVKYEDGNGKKYEAKETFSVKLVNVTVIQNILLALNQFGMFVGNLVS